MSVVAQLPIEMGGAEGKVVSFSTFELHIRLIRRMRLHILTPKVWLSFSHLCSTEQGFPGTFRPDRIKAIADRFGINGDDALGNILHGTHRLSDALNAQLRFSPCVQ